MKKNTKKMREKTAIAVAVLAVALSLPVSANVFAGEKSGLDTSAVLNAVTVSGGGEKSFITYDQPEKQILNEDYSYSGLKLTGGTGASFNLGNFKLDDGRFFFAGADFDKTAANEAWYARPSDFGDVFSYVYTDTAGTPIYIDTESETKKRVIKEDVQEMTVTIRQVGKEENYVSFKVTDRAEWGSECVDISAAATGNDSFKTVKYSLPNSFPQTITGREYDGNGFNTGNKGGLQNKVSFGNVARTIGKPGELIKPISLIWDNQKVSAFTNIANKINTPEDTGTYGAWCIRDFDVSEKDKYYLTYEKDMNVWGGFDDGATLNISVTFNAVKDGTRASIIVTSLGGYNLRALRTIVEVKDCPLVVNVENKRVWTGSEVTTPSAHYVNPINGSKFAAFSGTVNLYRKGVLKDDETLGDNVLIKENLEAGYTYIPENAETLIYEYVSIDGGKVTAEVIVDKRSDETVDSDTKHIEEKKDNWIKRAINSVKDFFKNTWQKVKDWFIKVWNKIKPGKNKKAAVVYVS